jgi:hypothetical protein
MKRVKQHTLVIRYLLGLGEEEEGEGKGGEGRKEEGKEERQG